MKKYICIFIIFLLQLIVIFYQKNENLNQLNELHAAQTGVLGNLSAILLIYQRETDHDNKDAEEMARTLLSENITYLKKFSSFNKALNKSDGSLRESYHIALKLLHSPHHNGTPR